MSLAPGEHGSETIYADAGTSIYLKATSGSKHADLSYTVSAGGDKNIHVTDADFH